MRGNAKIVVSDFGKDNRFFQTLRQIGWVWMIIATPIA